VRQRGLGLNVYYGRDVSSVESFCVSCFSRCRDGLVTRRSAAILRRADEWINVRIIGPYCAIGPRYQLTSRPSAGFIKWAHLFSHMGGRKSSSGIVDHGVKKSKQNQICSLRIDVKQASKWESHAPVLISRNS
jgi:hypothetical protein